MGTYSDLLQAQEKRAIDKKEAPTRRYRRLDKKQHQLKSIKQSTDQSTDRSTGQPTDPLTDLDQLGSIVPRPRAFYITEKLDQMLDAGVQYLQSKGIHKADRSVLVNALLHDPSLFEPEALDKLRSRLLVHLTNKLLKRG